MFIPSVLATLLVAAHTIYAQCPNEVARYHPNLRTGTLNSTWFLVAVDSIAVSKALDSTYGFGIVTLAEVPRNDLSLFPSGFRSDKHPVLVSIGYADNDQISSAKLPAFLTGQIYATFVRRPSSPPSTILTAPLSGYVDGLNGDTLSGIVPGIASTFVAGFPTRLGRFDPSNAAYKSNRAGALSSNMAWTAVPNIGKGLGSYISALDMQFLPSKTNTKFTSKLFRAVLNQPAILSGAYLLTNTCQRNQYYFNNATGIMLSRVGNVTFGPGADGYSQSISSLQEASFDGGGLFANQEGFSGCAQNVGYNPQDCDEASAQVDITSL